jgi:subtilisin family serine protease
MRFTIDSRGQTVEYEQLDDVLAVYRDTLPGGQDLAGLLEQIQLPWAGEDSPQLPFPSRRIFEQAGWRFVRGAPAAVKAALAGDGLAAGVDFRFVYVDDAGELKVGTWCLAVELKPDIRSDDAEKQLLKDGLELVRAMRFGTNLFEVRAKTRDLPIEEIVARLQADKKHYTFAEPVFLEPLTARGNADPKPKDPKFDKQWHHCTIQSISAWKNSLGNGVRIAIIDHGMHVNHPDLADRVVAGGFYKTTTQCGGDFCRFERNTFPADDHGTRCMGLAAAKKDNDMYGCGVAPGADLMAIACAIDELDTQFTLARAVAFAADPSTEPSGLGHDQGAHVIACSLGPRSGRWKMTRLLERAITFAAAGRGGLGVPIFWAVGDLPSDIEQDQVCSHRDVIAIGASTKADAAAGGATGKKLAFLAPGSPMYSTMGEDDFDQDSGSSYACPVAAGVAALVLSREPTLKREKLLERLLASCEQVGDYPGGYPNGRNPRYGHGRINADWAVNGKPKLLPPLSHSPASPPSDRPGTSPHQGAVVPVPPPSADGD